jgi:hypothetical protein
MKVSKAQRRRDAEGRASEPSAGITVTFEDITPEIATQYLEGNIHNRPIRMWLVEQYADEIRRGWETTHQGIAFDVRGTLVDGQHRLWAIIETGVTVHVMVTRGLPVGVGGRIDTGKPKTATERIGLDGVTQRTVQCCRAVERIKREYWGRWSASEEEELVGRHIRDVKRVLVLFKGSMALASPGVVAGVVLLRLPEAEEMALVAKIRRSRPQKVKSMSERYHMVQRIHAGS